MTAQSTPARTMTLEEFDAKYSGKRYEYVNGRAVPMGPEIVGPDGAITVAAAKPDHSLLVDKIQAVVYAFDLEHRLGMIFGAESGFVMQQDPTEIRAADLAFVSYERWRTVRRGEWLPVPDLAVEVISEYDTAQEIRDKAEDYMENGTRLLWIVYPDSRIIDVHRPGQPIVNLGVADHLDGGDVLPGFSIPVRDIFSPLDTISA